IRSLLYFTNTEMAIGETKGDRSSLINGVKDVEKLSNNVSSPSGQSQGECWHSTKRLMETGYGVGLGLMSGLSFATCSIFIHLIGHDVPALQINFITVVSIGCVIIPPLLMYRVSLKLESLKDGGLVFGKGVGYTIGIMGDVVALTLISTGNVTAITNGLLPVFTAIFGCIFLREMLRLVDVITIVLNVTGVVLITQPTFLFGDDDDDEYDEDDKLLGNIMAVASAVGFASAYVVQRGLGERLHVLSSLFYDAIIASLISVVMMFSVDEEPEWDMEGDTIGQFCGVAFSTALAQWCSYRCLQLEPAATAALLFNVEVVAAYSLEYLVVDRVPSAWEVTGAGLVLFSSGLVAVITWRLHMKKRREDEASGYLELE
ncbi:solute carrier family 35 member G1-like, partial [Saccoglossus kowalevskii]|uniref:Solute carrier family 35 member G1-like n=1 Tax=Saccoglossus kowalevskii TaxID=10224 RepID=A0ABM0MZM9_SACKO